MSTGCCPPTSRHRTRPTRPSGSRSGPPAIAGRRSTARSTRRTSRPPPRPSAAIGRARASVGPLFIGKDPHALSEPAFETALRGLVAHGVDVRVDAADGYTPTPVISHAILVHNRGGRDRLADGIVVTPSHNPPEDGGFKYNPPNGGPADTDVTRQIQDEANRLLEAGLDGVRQVSLADARAAVTPHDYVSAYVDDLAAVIDMDAIRASGLRLGVGSRSAARASPTGRGSASATAST